MDLLARFQNELESLALFQQGEAVVLGVSGGPDSLAMCHLFLRLREALGIELYALHLDHQIRGQESEADARFVSSLATGWGLPCYIARLDVPRIAKERKLSLEEAARRARYTLLGQEALRLGTRVVCVAHNADDQAETVLMHLLRGSGMAGLRGMLPVTPLSDYHLLEPVERLGEEGGTPLLVRPLLHIPRQDIEAYCAAQGLKPRFDRSNLDTTYFRNRLRHEAIPLLEALNPNLRKVLTRTASVLASDYEILEAQVEAIWRRIVLEETNSRVRLSLASWRELPLSLQRATIRRATWRLRRSLRDVSFEQVRGAVEVAQDGETGAQATLPARLELRVGYGDLLIAPVDQDSPPPDWPLLEPGTLLEIPVPGQVDLPETTWRFSLSPYEGPRSGAAWEALLAEPWATPLSADALSSTLALRTRQRGDRFRPQGVGGRQKLSAFMVNVKIPAAWREHIPLLIAGHAIAWVCGWRVDERFLVRPGTRQVWLARFDKQS